MAAASHLFPEGYLARFSEVDWAWLAGIVDGEGSIYIISGKYLAISVGNTDLRIVNRVADLFDKQPSKGRWSPKSTKPLYRVEVSGHKAEVIFEKIGKHLATSKGKGLTYKSLLSPRTYESTLYPRIIQH